MRGRERDDNGSNEIHKEVLKQKREREEA